MAASSSRALALVYRGPATTDGCPEAVAELLRDSCWDLEVAYVGPREPRALTAETLGQAVLYAQPGGEELGPAYRRLRRRAPAVRDFVSAGGRYLGFCLGGYLAGRTPGFDLLPGDTDQYITSAGASVTTEEDTVVGVRWRGERREVFFQDGCYVALDATGAAAQVLATYDNGLPAAVVAPYGRGAVGVVGPHPEATADWFTGAGLRPRDATDLGRDLLGAVMRA